MLEHFKGEEVFVKKVLDYIDQANYHPYYQSIVHRLIGKNEDIQ